MPLLTTNLRRKLCGHPRTGEAIRYAEDCISSEIPSTELHREICRRFLRDLKREKRWPYDPKALEHVCDFMEKLTVGVDSNMGSKDEKLVLMPFQIFILANLYGFHDGKSRRFTEANLFMPRKSGKSLLVGAMAGYALFADPLDKTPRILSGSVQADHAAHSWKALKTMIENTPELEDVYDIRIKDRGSDLEFISVRKTRPDGSPERDGSYGVVAGASKRRPGLRDGWLTSMAIVDETHLLLDDDIVQSFRRSGGSKPNRQMVKISTFGTEMNSVAYQDYRNIPKILEDPAGKFNRTFAACWCAEEGDNPLDIATWYKAQPAAGRLLNAEYFEDQAAHAEMGQENMTMFLIKDLNIWRLGANSWVAKDTVAALSRDISLDDYAHLPAFVSVDSRKGERLHRVHRGIRGLREPEGLRLLQNLRVQGRVRERGGEPDGLRRDQGRHHRDGDRLVRRGAPA